MYTYVYIRMYVCTLYYYTIINPLELVITNGPMNVTVCGGTNAKISCGFTGVSDPSSTLPNWSWRISNETVTVTDINANKADGLVFYIISSNTNGINSADDSYLLVGPVDDTYNNTSYQCIFTINGIIIESGTTGTVTVIDGTYV